MMDINQYYIWVQFPTSLKTKFRIDFLFHVIIMIYFVTGKPASH